jgi:8-amino-7-oxononanoate synthase
MEPPSTAHVSARAKGYFQHSHSADGPYDPQAVVDGRNTLMFSSNNCLGLLNDSRVIAAAAEGLRKWGIGSGSCGLLGGHSDVHKKLEESVAHFKKREACLAFSTGFLANSGTLPAIVDILDPSLLMLDDSISRESETIIFSDECNYTIALAGIRMRNATTEIFRHNDMADLRRKLKTYPRQKRKLILVEGVFGMDGDVASLPDIVSLARKHNAMVYLDDANATGILGKNGRGVEEYYGMTGEVDVVVGTLARGFGGEGGFVVGSSALVDYLQVSAKTYMFSAPISPPIACGLIKAIDIIREEPWRRTQLLSNAEYLRNELIELGLNICGSQTHIVPVFLGDEGRAYAAAQFLSERGIHVPTTMWPTVPEGRARLRISVMYNHTREQLNYLISAVKEMKQRMTDGRPSFAH